MEPVRVNSLCDVRAAAVLFVVLACLMQMLTASHSLQAQSTPAPDVGASSQGGVSELKSPAYIPKLPAGFFIQDVTAFSSALFASVPGSQETTSGLPFGAGGWQTGFGVSLDMGWTKSTPRTTFSVASSTSLTEYRQAERGRNWNEYLNASIKRQMSARLRSQVFTHLVITDQQQFLFGEVPESGLAINPASVITPAASNLLLVQRNLLVSAGGQVWYDYSPRTTLSLEAEVVRNQAVGSGDQGTPTGTFNSISESATGTLAYAVSRRSEVDVSLATVRTTAPMDTSIYASTQATYSYGLSDSWLARVHAGMSVGSSTSAISSSSSNTLWFSTPFKTYPIGGASLEYHRKINSLVLSSNRGVTEIYGAGAAIVWSSNATWNISPLQSHWNFSFRAGYDLSSSGAQERIDGWRADAGVNRSFSRQLSASCQYAFLSSLYRYPTAMQSMRSHGVRIALVWTPAAKDKT